MDLAVRDSVAIEGEGKGECTAVCDFHRGLLELLPHGIKLFVNARLQLNLKYIDLVLMLYIHLQSGIGVTALGL